MRSPSIDLGRFAEPALFIWPVLGLNILLLVHLVLTATLNTRARRWLQAR